MLAQVLFTRSAPVLHAAAALVDVEELDDDPVGHVDHAEGLLVEREVLGARPHQVELNVPLAAPHADDDVVLPALHPGGVVPLRDWAQVNHLQEGGQRITLRNTQESKHGR